MRLPVSVILSLATTASAAVELPASEHGAAAQDSVDSVLRDSHLRFRLLGSEPQASALRVLQRIGVRRPLWQGVLLTERDPGEHRWTDHRAGYVQARTSVVDVTVGSLRPALGQGLLFARGRSDRMSVRPRRDNPRLGSSSSSETRDLLGIGWVRSTDAGMFMAVAGRLAWDARFDEAGRAVSLPEDGDHSNGQRPTLSGAVVGGRWRQRLHTVCIGMTVQHLRFTRLVDLRRPSQSSNFVGTQQASVAVDVVDLQRRWHAVFARAGDDRAVRLGLSGIDIAGCRIGGVWEWFATGYFAPLAVAGSGTQGGRRITLAARRRGAQVWAERTFQPAAAQRHPQSAVRRGAGARWRRRYGSWLADSSIQRRISSAFVSASPGTDSTTRFRLQLRTEGRCWRWTTRLDAAGYRRRLHQLPTESQGGRSLATSVRWRRDGWHVQALLTTFDTQGYGARIYEYEPDVPDAVSIRPLYGRGERLVVVAVLPLVPRAQLSLRWRAQHKTGWSHVAAVQLDIGASLR